MHRGVKKALNENREGKAMQGPEVLLYIEQATVNKTEMDNKKAKD